MLISIQQIQMNGFFTPVQVIKKHHWQYPSQKLDKFQLFQITQPLIISLAEERKQLKHWLKTLTLPQRRRAATIYSVEFVCLIRRLFQDASRANQYSKYKYVFVIRQGKYVIRRQKYYCSQTSPSEQFLLKQIVLISQAQLFQAFTLSDYLLNDTQALFKLIDEIQGADPQVVYDLNHFTEEQLSTAKISFETEIEEGEPKTLGKWIAEMVFKQISLGFVRKDLWGQQWGLEEMRVQETQFSNLWRLLGAQQRRRVVLKGLNRSFEEILDDYKYSVAVACQQLPCLYIQRNKDQVIQQIVNCNPKSLYCFLIYTYLSHSLEIYSMQKISIVLQIQAYLAIQKQQQSHDQKKKKKKKKNIVPTLRQKSAEKELNRQTQGKSLQQQVSIEKLQSRQRKKEQVQASTHLIKDGNIQRTAETGVTLKTASLGAVKPASGEKMKDEVNELVERDDYSLKDGQQRKQWSREQSVFKLADNENVGLIAKDGKDVLVEKVENEDNRCQGLDKKQLQKDKSLQSYCAKLRENNRDKLRKIVYHRFLYVFSLFQIGCRAFGSFANNLALPHSDLDIIIDSSILSYFYTESHSPKIQIVTALQEIQNMLRHQSWVFDFELLPKARIPILIFKADAGMHFTIKGNHKTKLKVNGRNIGAGQGIIHVDLSIQPFHNVPELMHLGCRSTELIKEWIEQHQLFSQLLIINKSFLKKLDLHKSYSGGISSFTLAVLVIAFLRFAHPKVTSLALVMEAFVKFLKMMYEGCWLIDLQRGISQSKHEKTVVLSPCDGANLLERSFRAGQLIEGLRSWEQLMVEQTNH